MRDEQQGREGGRMKDEESTCGVRYEMRFEGGEM